MSKLPYNPSVTAYAVPPPFLRRLTKQSPVAWAPLAKELPVGLRIDNIINYSRFTDSRKGCPYDFVFQLVADDAHIVQKGFLHYSPAANWFVGDAEPYGF